MECFFPLCFSSYHHAYISKSDSEPQGFFSIHTIYISFVLCHAPVLLYKEKWELYKALTGLYRFLGFILSASPRSWSRFEEWNSSILLSHPCCHLRNSTPSSHSNMTIARLKNLDGDEHRAVEASKWDFTNLWLTQHGYPHIWAHPSKHIS